MAALTAAGGAPGVTAGMVRAALRGLSEEHRAVLIEVQLRGAGTAEAAARLGIPETVVGIRVLAALRALRAALDNAATA